MTTGCVSECRGCSHRDKTAEESEKAKQDWLQSQLQPWTDQLRPIYGVRGATRESYRRKVCLHAQWEKGSWKLGLLLPPPRGAVGAERFQVVAIPNCPVHHPLVRKVVQVLSSSLPAETVFPLRYVALSGTLLTLVLKSQTSPPIPSLDWSELGLTGVFFNLNPSSGNRVFSNRGWKKVWGDDVASEFGFQYGPESFQQQIPVLHEAALAEAEEFLRPGASDAVIDLYSGIGRSLRLWKERGADSIGVELSGDAFRASVQNVGEESSLRGRASDRIPQLREWMNVRSSKNFLLYANPPRMGLEPAVLNWITKEAQPIRMAYLSCSQGTLRRDLTFLCESGYTVERVIPFDFFPQTHHLETLALLKFSSEGVKEAQDDLCH